MGESVRPMRWARLIVAAALALAPLPTHADPQPGAALVTAAREALRRGDGIDAEVKLREALKRGVPKEQLAAYFGGAYLRQGNRDRARQWLGPGVFSGATRAEGFRLLAQLEQLDNNLPAAGAAYDRVLALLPDDPELWVEIGRLRYRGGQHVLAIAAADHAIALGPQNVRALEFRGQLIRDRYGLLPALPWFEAALVHAPDDVSVLTDYAATLGELGRASEMLTVTRRILQLDAGNPRAYYLQAVLAARAGRYELARGLLARTRNKLEDLPGPLLLQALLELGAGNTKVASELCEQFLDQQPDNIRARELLARTLYVSGQNRYLTIRFRDDIARKNASPYILTTVARGFEALGDRAEAGRLLDLAAKPQRAALHVVAQGTQIGALMAQGRSDEALASAERQRDAQPGTYASQALAGDVQLALGNARAAQERYVAAAQIRMSQELLVRRLEAYAAAGDPQGAAQMVRAWLIENPGDRVALRLEADMALREGDGGRALAILDYLRRSGAEQDVKLLSDLSFIQLQAQSPDVAANTATIAYRLQRANPLATQALALGFADLADHRSAALALIEKARRMLGDNPMLAEARGKLMRNRRV